MQEQLLTPCHMPSTALPALLSKEQKPLDVLCNIFKLREKVVESLDVVGRASVKDATGIDIKRNCIEVILVRWVHAMRCACIMRRLLCLNGLCLLLALA